VTSCVCSIEADHIVDCCRVVIRRARKEHVCIECRSTIRIGEQYERASGIDEGEVFSQATCLPCMRIWEDRFDGRVFGGFLWEYLWDCSGLDLTKAPERDGDEADEIDDEDAEHVAAARRRAEVTK